MLVSSEKTRPGAGATAAYLEASTGRRAYYLGKPNGYMFHRARRKLASLALNEPDQVVMIGDTMETDIRGAFEAASSRISCSAAQPSLKPWVITCISRRASCRTWATWWRKSKPAVPATA